MSRKELAKELGVTPWTIDDWLLKGCPAIKIRSQWEFDLDQVKNWLKTEKIRIRRVKPLPSFPFFNERWLGKRCPLCIDRGFPGEKAGLLYNFGEVLGGRWQLRRTGIPCGHSQIIDPSQLTKEKEAGFLF
ncbi:MAG: hypothetical protein ACUVWV_14560 [Thermodesulfobacteriota bacterium]